MGGLPIIQQAQVVDLGLGGVGSDGLAVRTVGSMGDWNQARDWDGAEDSRSAQLDGQNNR